jgi:FAD/FMN-containing dehydrogenase
MNSEDGFLLPSSRLEKVQSWGMNREALAYVYRPSTVVGLREALNDAQRAGRTVGIRGGGCSYGDASINSENVVLDITRMNRILRWEPQEGIIEIEPGVTLQRLWQYVIGDGWWPPVVSGTMFVTMGGAVGMNYHGKNNYKMGPIGEHVLEFDLLLADGTIVTCSREQRPDVFYAAIGGFGMLGCFTRLVMKMKRVYSGLLEVDAFATSTFKEIARVFEERMAVDDYLVGWIDCLAGSKGRGRGLVHAARYLKPGDDTSANQTLQIAFQDLPDTMFGLMPKSIMWRFLKPFSNDTGMRLINWAKYVMGSTLGNNKTSRQSHAAFAFLLDYVPNWKRVYLPGGLIQYQSFVPAEHAAACFDQQMEICRKFNVFPWLGVFKRHRTDNFLMTHAVDGYSLALDFPVRKRSADRLKQAVSEMNRVVLESGGRFYFAKDSMLTPDDASAYLGEDVIARFRQLKRELDPNGLWQTDLSRRLFGKWNSDTAPNRALQEAR